MGIGVYENTFQGSGGTFIVDPGPMDDPRANHASVLETAPIDRPTIPARTDRLYDEFKVGLVDALRDIGGKLRMPTKACSGFWGQQSSFDNDFIGAIFGDILEVGWRSWQGKFIIAVGPSLDWQPWAVQPLDPEEEMYQTDAIFTRTGRAPSDLKNLFDDTRIALQDCVRLELMDRGYTCLFRTTEDTSSAYFLPADIRNRLARLSAEIERNLQELTASAATTLSRATSEDRIRTVRQLLVDSSGNYEPHLLVAVYETASGVVWLQAPGAKRSLVDMSTATRWAFLPGHIGEGPWLAIPLVDETRDLFYRLQDRAAADCVVLTAQEFAEITGENCVFKIPFGADSGTEITLASPALTAAPPDFR